MQRLIVLFLVTLCVVSGLKLFPQSAYAAVNFESFDTQVMLTDAEDIHVPGVSFAGNHNFLIFPAISSTHISNQALGQQPRYIPEIGQALTLNFAATQGSTTFGWRIKADDTLIVNGYLAGNHVFTQTFVGDLNTDIPAIFYEQTATVTGKYDSLVLSSTAGELLVIDNLSSNDYGSSNIPNIGMVQINRSQAQPAYGDAGGGVARDGNGNEIWLPNDADDSFADTYVVTGTQLVDGQWWVQLFLGSTDFVWVPLNKVTALSSLVEE